MACFPSKSVSLCLIFMTWFICTAPVRASEPDSETSHEIPKVSATQETQWPAKELPLGFPVFGKGAINGVLDHQKLK